MKARMAVLLLTLILCGTACGRRDGQISEEGRQRIREAIEDARGTTTTLPPNKAFLAELDRDQVLYGEGSAALDLGQQVCAWARSDPKGGSLLVAIDRVYDKYADFNLRDDELDIYLSAGHNLCPEYGSLIGNAIFVVDKSKH